MTLRNGSALALALVAGAAASTWADVTVLPTLPHAAFNFIPFGSGPGPCVQHQVFSSVVWAGLSGGQPVQITRIAFSPQSAGQVDLGSTTIRMGYTARTAGALPPAGLDIPVLPGGGAPNASGPMTDFYVNPAHVVTVTGGLNVFDMVLNGTPFVYDPSLGNLLVEIISNNNNTTFAVSRSAGGAESSRAYNGGRFAPAASNTTATRIEFTYSIGAGATGACCVPDGQCIVTTPVSCANASGIYRGDGTTCPANCPQPATGACCLASGCSVLTQAQCTTQGGTYAGNNVTCQAANCPQPCPPITGAIGGPSQGWPSTHGQQNTRLFRDGVPDTCLLSASGGAPIAGTYAYDEYTFVNTSANPACVRVDVNTACTGTNFIYAAAYIGGYVPANPTQNNVASVGGSPNPTATMSFTVPGNTSFQVVFTEVTAGAGCPNYTFQVSGGNFDCNTAACYPDCNGDHALNVNDFICFQSAFAAQTAQADCDHNSQLNVNDFICFQSAFAAGCSQL